jgi:hypothetical protein
MIGQSRHHCSVQVLQLGPTDKSNYFIYWFPAQLVEAVKVIYSCVLSLNSHALRVSDF